MRNRLIFLFAIILFSNALIGQSNLDSLMTRQSLECPDIANNSSILFSRYIQEKKIDSATQILTYWKSKCGINEPVQRAMFMLGMAKGEPVDTLTGDDILNYLYGYKYRLQLMKELKYSAYYRNPSYFDFVPIGQEFDIAAIGFFKQQAQQHSAGLEHLLALAYATNPDTIYTLLNQPAYYGTRLYNRYSEQANRYKKLPRMNVALLTGVWVPTGAASKLGVHPEVGFQLGITKRKMSYDLTMAFRFLQARQAYEARRAHSNNAVETTRKFFGGYIGLDAGRFLYTSPKSDVQLLGGLAFDGWDALKEDKARSLRAETVSSYNINFGLGYRRFVKNNTYLGIRAKYNVVNYALNNIVDFTGNPVSVTLVIGALSPQFN